MKAAGPSPVLDVVARITGVVPESGTTLPNDFAHSQAVEALDSAYRAGELTPTDLKSLGKQLRARLGPESSSGVSKEAIDELIQASNRVLLASDGPLTPSQDPVGDIHRMVESIGARFGAGVTVLQTDAGLDDLEHPMPRKVPWNAMLPPVVVSVERPGRAPYRGLVVLSEYLPKAIGGETVPSWHAAWEPPKWVNATPMQLEGMVVEIVEAALRDER